IYELPVLKKLAKPLLQTVSKGSSVYPEAQRLLHFLEPFCELDTSLVPSNSLLREFVGHGNV
ncbi:MAG: nucleoside kinase, partial [Dialister sp.]|nr:nucleoside kinase [Dialister sp.]